MDHKPSDRVFACRKPPDRLSILPVKRIGANLLYYTVFETAWGYFGLAARAERLRATLLPQPESNLRRTILRRWPDAVESVDLLPSLRDQVVDYFDGKPATFHAALDLSALTPFRRAVLEACRRIPYGRTVSYLDLARAVGQPGAARAVGGAMAANPVPLVIPCHRVLRSDGALGGFSSPRGVEEKRRLLLLEKATQPTRTQVA